MSPVRAEIATTETTRPAPRSRPGRAGLRPRMRTTRRTRRTIAPATTMTRRRRRCGPGASPSSAARSVPAAAGTAGVSSVILYCGSDGTPPTHLSPRVSHGGRTRRRFTSSLQGPKACSVRARGPGVERVRLRPETQLLRERIERGLVGKGVHRPQLGEQVRHDLVHAGPDAPVHVRLVVAHAAADDSDD